MRRDMLGAMAPANDVGPQPRRVCFFFNAQRHQLLHGISTAVELARIDGFDVHVSSPSADHIAYARRLVRLLGGAPIRFSIASATLLTALRRRQGSSVPPKLLSLGLLARYLDRFDAIAVPERTTVQLRSFGAPSPHYIHLDHGAGDRAAGFDPRIADFDMVLIPGDKHRERLDRERLIHSGRYAVTGYPKFDAADAIRDPRWNPFVEKRPTVLYNPHFSDLGSWKKFGLPLLRAFAEQDRYNLIVAPHVRMLDSRKKRARWAAMTDSFAAHGHIYIDAGSDRSIDMTYTMLADIYVGDVSSQVYEFLRTPKPCLFLDSQGIDWAKDENYTHWRFGPVVRSPEGLIGAIDTACATHAQFASVQTDGFAQTFAPGTASASARAASAIAAYLHTNIGKRESGSTPAIRATMRRIARVAASVAIFTVGWLMHDIAGPLDSPAQAESAFVAGAIKSHKTAQIRATMASVPEATRLDRGEIQRVTGITLLPFPRNWRLTDVQIYPSTAGPMVQVAATTAQGEAISFVAMRINNENDTKPILSNQDGERVAYWEDEGDAFAIVGTLPAARLLTLASDIARIS